MSCPVCAHPSRPAIDQALSRGESLRPLAKAHGVSRTALSEHALGCLKLAPRLAGRKVSDGGQSADSPADMSTGPRKPSPMPPRAREAGDPKLAESYENRVKFCADILVRGQWTGRPVVAWLSEVWGVSRETVGEYRRAGAVLAAGDRGGLDEALEDTLGAFRRQEEAAEAHAETLEAGNKPGEAVRYRQLALKAREDGAQVLGLLQSRVTVSLEADTRIAGLWAVVWEALGELDAARERYVEEVARMTGGTVPGVELPPAADAVRLAVRKYEVSIGARTTAGALNQ